MPGLLSIISDQYRLWRTEKLLDQGRLTSASSQLSRVSERVGPAARAWRLKGRLLAQAGLPRAAVQCFIEAGRIPGASMRQILELAWSLMNARDFERAEAILISYIHRAPQDQAAPRLLAHLYRAQGRCETALEVLRLYRPRRVVGKYAPLMPPPLKLGWIPERAWREGLQALGYEPQRFEDPASMALDRQGRDDLLCAFDDLAKRPGGMKALAYGVGRALDSGEPWLIAWVRRAEAYLRLDMPVALPPFLARHGGVEDRSLLLAGLAAGSRERLLSAAALVSLGFEEFQEVLDELRSGPRHAISISADAWALAGRLLPRLIPSPETV